MKTRAAVPVAAEVGTAPVAFKAASEENFSKRSCLCLRFEVLLKVIESVVPCWNVGQVYLVVRMIYCCLSMLKYDYLTFLMFYVVLLITV